MKTTKEKKPKTIQNGYLKNNPNAPKGIGREHQKAALEPWAGGRGSGRVGVGGGVMGRKEVMIIEPFELWAFVECQHPHTADA